jgi:hypothetical protein
MPEQNPPRRQTRGPRRTIGAALVVACAALLAACSNSSSSADSAPDGLVAIIADADGTTVLGWDGTGGEPIPITLPKGDPAWVATGRAGVLAAVLADGTAVVSDPLHLGAPLAWRAAKAVGPNGRAPKGPNYFASWDPDGGRFATLAGDLVAGNGIRVLLIDPTAGSATEIKLAGSVVAAPPAWIDKNRLVVVTGDATEPTTTIVDTSTGESTEGPIDVRSVASSADGRRIATMAGQGAPVVVRDTAGWLAGDGSSLGSIDPVGDSATAIAFALDATGQRIVIAWAANDGTVTLAIHDGRSAWRRIAQPTIGPTRGAVVAWRR